MKKNWYREKQRRISRQSTVFNRQPAVRSPQSVVFSRTVLSLQSVVGKNNNERRQFYY